MADIRPFLSRVGSETTGHAAGGRPGGADQKLVDKRAKAYAQADFIINTSSLTIDQVAQEILEHTCKNRDGNLFLIEIFLFRLSLSKKGYRPLFLPRRSLLF